MDNRIAREKEFHDDRFATRPERSITMAGQMFYITRQALISTYKLLEKEAKDKVVLDYGCGQGEASLIVAEKYDPVHITGIDISDVAVEQAKAQAKDLGLDNTDFMVMNAESMAFDDNSFDLIFGFGILHHLDLNVALKEIARVLKQDGTCIFLEPLGHNPAINLYRRLTPALRTPDEHPLLMKDFALVRKYFKEVNLQFVNLFTLFTIPFAKMPRSQNLVNGAAAIDRFIFKLVPFTRRYAWNVVMVFSQPNKHMKR